MNKTEAEIASVIIQIIVAQELKVVGGDCSWPNWDLGITVPDYASCISWEYLCQMT